MTTKSRANTLGPRCTEALFLRLAGDSVSRGVTRMKTKPQMKDSSAGSKKAARQPTYLTISPVRIAATAMPMLPASPLMPIVRPGFGACCSSIGIPTGW